MSEVKYTREAILPARTYYPCAPIVVHVASRDGLSARSRTSRAAALAALERKERQQARQLAAVAALHLGLEPKEGGES